MLPYWLDAHAQCPCFLMMGLMQMLPNHYQPKTELYKLTPTSVYSPSLFIFYLSFCMIILIHKRFSAWLFHCQFGPSSILINQCFPIWAELNVTQSLANFVRNHVFIIILSIISICNFVAIKMYYYYIPFRCMTQCRNIISQFLF